MSDRTTKILLAIIGLGLWANVLKTETPRAMAEGMADLYLSSIDTNIARLARGTCTNSKLC